MHNTHSATASTREARLLCQRLGPAPEPNLDRLHMRESEGTDEVTKNRYAYDSIKARIEAYQQRAQALFTKLGTPNADQILIHESMTAPLDAQREVQLRFTHENFMKNDKPLYYFARDAEGRILWSNAIDGNYQVLKDTAGNPTDPESFYQKAVVVRAGKKDVNEPYLRYRMGRKFDTYKYKDINERSAGTIVDAQLQARERVSRMFWNVQNLEMHYAVCEKIIADLEQQAEEKKLSKEEERLRLTQLKERNVTLDAQMKATADADKLQTIHLDNFSQPFTQISDRAYHLLRLPGDVKAEFVLADSKPGAPPIGTDIAISGGAKYYKISQATIASLDPGSTKLKLTRGKAEVGVAEIALSTDGLKNLIFTFPPKPPVKPEPEPEKEPKEAEFRILHQAIYKKLEETGKIPEAEPERQKFQEALNRIPEGKRAARVEEIGKWPDFSGFLLTDKQPDDAFKVKLTMKDNRAVVEIAQAPLGDEELAKEWSGRAIRRNIAVLNSFKELQKEKDVVSKIGTKDSLIEKARDQLNKDMESNVPSAKARGLPKFAEFLNGYLARHFEGKEFVKTTDKETITYALRWDHKKKEAVFFETNRKVLTKPEPLPDDKFKQLIAQAIERVKTKDAFAAELQQVAQENKPEACKKLPEVDGKLADAVTVLRTAILTAAGKEETDKVAASADFGTAVNGKLKDSLNTKGFVADKEKLVEKYEISWDGKTRKLQFTRSERREKEPAEILTQQRAEALERLTSDKDLRSSIDALKKQQDALKKTSEKEPSDALKKAVKICSDHLRRIAKPDAILQDDLFQNGVRKYLGQVNDEGFVFTNAGKKEVHRINFQPGAAGKDGTWELTQSASELLPLADLVRLAIEKVKKEEFIKKTILPSLMDWQKDKDRKETLTLPRPSVALGERTKLLRLTIGDCFRFDFGDPKTKEVMEDKKFIDFINDELLAGLNKNGFANEKGEIFILTFDGTTMTFQPDPSKPRLPALTSAPTDIPEDLIRKLNLTEVSKLLDAQQTKDLPMPGKELKEALNTLKVAIMVAGKNDEKILNSPEFTAAVNARLDEEINMGGYNIGNAKGEGFKLVYAAKELTFDRKPAPTDLDARIAALGEKEFTNAIKAVREQSTVAEQVKDLPAKAGIALEEALVALRLAINNAADGKDDVRGNPRFVEAVNLYLARMINQEGIAVQQGLMMKTYVLLFDGEVLTFQDTGKAVELLRPGLFDAELTEIGNLRAEADQMKDLPLPGRKLQLALDRLQAKIFAPAGQRLAPAVLDMPEYAERINALLDAKFNNKEGFTVKRDDLTDWYDLRYTGARELLFHWIEAKRMLKTHINETIDMATAKKQIADHLSLLREYDGKENVSLQKAKDAVEFVKNLVISIRKLPGQERYVPDLPVKPPLVSFVTFISEKRRYLIEFQDVPMELIELNAEGTRKRAEKAVVALAALKDQHIPEEAVFALVQQTNRALGAARTEMEIEKADAGKAWHPAVDQFPCAILAENDRPMSIAYDRVQGIFWMPMRPAPETKDERAALLAAAIKKIKEGDITAPLQDIKALQTPENLKTIFYPDPDDNKFFGPLGELTAKIKATTGSPARADLYEDPAFVNAVQERLDVLNKTPFTVDTARTSDAYVLAYADGKVGFVLKESKAKDETIATDKDLAALKQKLSRDIEILRNMDKGEGAMDPKTAADIVASCNQELLAIRIRDPDFSPFLPQRIALYGGKFGGRWLITYDGRRLNQLNLGDEQAILDRRMSELASLRGATRTWDDIQGKIQLLNADLESVRRWQPDVSPATAGKFPFTYQDEYGNKLEVRYNGGQFEQKAPERLKTKQELLRNMGELREYDNHKLNESDEEDLNTLLKKTNVTLTKLSGLIIAKQAGQADLPLDELKALVSVEYMNAKGEMWHVIPDLNAASQWIVSTEKLGTPDELTEEWKNAKIEVLALRSFKKPEDEIEAMIDKANFTVALARKAARLRGEKFTAATLEFPFVGKDGNNRPFIVRWEGDQLTWTYEEKEVRAFENKQEAEKVKAELTKLLKEIGEINGKASVPLDEAKVIENNVKKADALLQRIRGDLGQPLFNAPPLEVEFQVIEDGDVFRDWRAEYKGDHYVLTKLPTRAEMEAEKKRLYKEGVDAFKAREYEKAATSFERARGLTAGRDDDIEFALSQTYLVLGKPELAEKALLRSMDADKQWRMRSFRYQDFTPEVAGDLEAAVSKLDGKTETGKFLRGVQWWLLDNRIKAMIDLNDLKGKDEYKKYILLFIEAPDVVLGTKDGRLGKRILQMPEREYGRAITRLQAAAREDPRNAEWPYLLAQGCILLGKYTEAKDAILRGMQLDPDWTNRRLDAKDLLGRNEKDVEGELKKLEQAQKDDPNDAPLQFLLAHQYWLLNRKDESLFLFQLAKSDATLKEAAEKFLEAAK